MQSTKQTPIPSFMSVSFLLLFSPSPCLPFPRTLLVGSDRGSRRLVKCYEPPLPRILRVGQNDVTPQKQLDHTIIHLTSSPSLCQSRGTHVRIQRLVPSLIHEFIQIVSKRHHFAIVVAKQRLAHVDKLCEQLFESLFLQLEFSIQLPIPSKIVDQSIRKTP